MPTLEEIAAGLEGEDPLALPDPVDPQSEVTIQEGAGPKTVSGKVANALVTRLGRVAAMHWNNIEAAQQGTSPEPMGRQALGEVGVNDAGQTTIGSTDTLFDPKRHVMLRDPTGRPMAYNRTPQTDEDRMSSFARLFSSGIADAPPAWRPLTQGKPPALKGPEMMRVHRDLTGRFTKAVKPQASPEDLTGAQKNTGLALGAGTLGYQMMKNREDVR